MPELAFLMYLMFIHYISQVDQLQQMTTNTCNYKIHRNCNYVNICIHTQLCVCLQ
jgi:hypothetical protein